MQQATRRTRALNLTTNIETTASTRLLGAWTIDSDDSRTYPSRADSYDNVGRVKSLRTLCSDFIYTNSRSKQNNAVQRLLRGIEKVDNFNQLLNDPLFFEAIDSLSNVPNLEILIRECWTHLISKFRNLYTAALIKHSSVIEAFCECNSREIQVPEQSGEKEKEVEIISASGENAHSLKAAKAFMQMLVDMVFLGVNTSQEVRSLKLEDLQSNLTTLAGLNKRELKRIFPIAYNTRWSDFSNRVRIAKAFRTLESYCKQSPHVSRRNANKALQFLLASWSDRLHKSEKYQQLAYLAAEQATKMIADLEQKKRLGLIRRLTTYELEHFKSIAELFVTDNENLSMEIQSEIPRSKAHQKRALASAIIPNLPYIFTIGAFFLAPIGAFYRGELTVSQCYEMLTRLFERLLPQSSSTELNGAMHPSSDHNTSSDAALVAVTIFTIVAIGIAIAAKLTVAVTSVTKNYDQTKRRK